MFERIDRLITNHDFAFQAWSDRYGKGVWAALGLWENMVDTVRDLSSAGDLDMIAATEYVFSVSWLPMVTGRTLNEAMAALEEKLASLPQDQLNRGSEWRLQCSVRSKTCAIPGKPQMPTVILMASFRRYRPNSMILSLRGDM